MITLFLDSEMFNTKYTITGMANSSLILKDKQTGEQVLAHRRIINAITHANTSIECVIMERTYKGRTDKWLATFFTF